MQYQLKQAAVIQPQAVTKALRLPLLVLLPHQAHVPGTPVVPLASPRWVSLLLPRLQLDLRRQVAVPGSAACILLAPQRVSLTSASCVNEMQREHVESAQMQMTYMKLMQMSEMILLEDDMNHCHDARASAAVSRTRRLGGPVRAQSADP